MWRLLCSLALLSLIAAPLRAEIPQPKLTPLHVTVDLNLGESQEVTLTSGKKVTVKVVDLDEQRDSLRGAVRKAEVKVLVDGKEVTLVSANYRLPATVGEVQIDCPVTRGYRDRATKTTGGLDVWGLDKAVRLRLWPAGSPLVESGDVRAIPRSSGGSPAARRWPTSRSYVDGGEKPGMDARSTTTTAWTSAEPRGWWTWSPRPSGLVVSVGKEVLPGYADTPVSPRYDVIYLLDDRGWYYRYSHLHTIRPEIRPGHDGEDRPAARPARQGRGQRRLVASALRHQRPPAVGQVGHHRRLRVPLGSLPPRAQAAAPRRRPAAPLRRRGRKSDARRQPLVVGTGSIASHDWTLHRRHDGERRQRSSAATTSRASTARSCGSPTRTAASTTTSPSSMSSTRSIPKRLPPSIHAAYSPDARHQSRARQ